MTAEISVESSVIEQTDEAMVDNLLRLPYAYASSKGVFLSRDDQGSTVLHYMQPLDVLVLAEVRRVAGVPLLLDEMPEGDFRAQLTQAYQKSSSEAVLAAEQMGDNLDLSRLADEIPETSDLMDEDEQAPVKRLINAILSQALREKASDIHIETFEHDLVVRFRVDGVLREVLRPKRVLAPLLISRLKVLSKLDIAEKRIPQDGRISVLIAGHAVDIRLSTNPTAHGERIVLRLLDKQAGQLELTQLQMPDGILQDYQQALELPHGIILVTGPTGSGKTTSLYAGLTHINDESRNILTIEDPVEYVLPGIGQTPVNPKVDMTFARGLRAILRQDPDVVMIGEIRDRETAEIAIQASLTGHLVLSTLHTNTAIGAINRLSDMGVEPYLLASSLSALMSQRLVRRLCDVCKEPYEASEYERQLLGESDSKQPITLYQPKGCKDCHHQGFRGRMGIYEFIRMDDTMRKMVHDQASESTMLDYARKTYPAIREGGFVKAREGKTTLNEVMRVVSG